MTGLRADKSLIIVGAGPAGLAVARAYREHAGAGQVTLVGAEPILPYSRPPLSTEFLRGETELDDLLIETPEWFADNDVELRLGEQVCEIDAASGTVRIGTESLSADAVVLGTGSDAVRPDIPGLDDERVRTLREYADSAEIRNLVERGTRVVVIGTGFIGCEMAASLAMRGADVVLVGQDEAPQQQRLGQSTAEQIRGWLQNLGVSLHMETAVSAVHDGTIVELDGGEQLEADLVLLGMGARPRVELAQTAGLKLDGGGVPTDEQMHAGGRVMAVGDVAYAMNTAAGRRLRVEHWGDAITQGEVAGCVLAGGQAAWSTVPGFWSTIGTETLKYAAWGDSYDSSELTQYPGGGFTVWYYRDDLPVGVLTHDRDHDYESGADLIKSQATSRGES